MSTAKSKIIYTLTDEAPRLAHEIAGKSPDAVAGAKRLLNLAGRVPLADGFAEEARVQRTILASPNQIEAVSASLEQRQARFTDRA